MSVSVGILSPRFRESLEQDAKSHSLLANGPANETAKASLGNEAFWKSIA